MATDSVRCNDICLNTCSWRNDNRQNFPFGAMTTAAINCTVCTHVWNAALRWLGRGHFYGEMRCFCPVYTALTS